MRILILGGYGFFGIRLARRLANEGALTIVIAGRSQQKAESAVEEIRLTAKASLAALALDLDAPDLASALALQKVDLVVHAAGPFQGQHYTVAKACIEASCHYVDLADATEFVLGIAQLDAYARRNNVLVCSGASSVPALSCAVIDELAADFASVSSIDIGISPGNRTERGLATVTAILTYCGQRLPGEAREFGWAGSWSHGYGSLVGRRWLSPCDVPDRLLFPPRYVGTPQVRFGAGLELTFLHKAMQLLAWLAQNNFVENWSRYAGVLHGISRLFQRFGSDCGAMHVSVNGTSAAGGMISREWQLIASAGDGPYVPTLASAAIIRKLLNNTLAERGACPCVGLLTLADFEQEFSGLAIEHQVSERKN